MAPSFDGALSSLLCAEDNLSIFYGADNVGLVDDFQINASHHRNHRTLIQELGFNGGEGFARLLPMASEECLSLMIERETEHLPGPDYLSRLRNGDLDLKARKEAVDWICRVQSHYNFGPLSAYLSINYLDRFLSTYKLPSKVWMVQLLAVAALSLAAKMEETEVPLSLDLQIGESKFIFESKTIQRMELLVLSTLKWRMQSVTPFSLVDYFLCKLNGDQMPPRSSICRSIQLIMSTVKGIDFLEFRPSEIAAAVAISVTVETETVDTSKAISLISEHVEKVKAGRNWFFPFVLLTPVLIRKKKNGFSSARSKINGKEIEESVCSHNHRICTAMQTAKPCTASAMILFSFLSFEVDKLEIGSPALFYFLLVLIPVAGLSFLCLNVISGNNMESFPSKIKLLSRLEKEKKT